MAAYDGENAGRLVKAGLYRVAEAIEAASAARERSARASLANLSDEKLDRLERVLGMLLKVQERD